MKLTAVLLLALTFYFAAGDGHGPDGHHDGGDEGPKPGEYGPGGHQGPDGGKPMPDGGEYGHDGDKSYPGGDKPGPDGHMPGPGEKPVYGPGGPGGPEDMGYYDSSSHLTAGVATIFCATLFALLKHFI